MLNATEAHIAAINAKAFNAAAREMLDGVRMTHEQSDEIGDEGKMWLIARLGLAARTDDAGVTYTTHRIYEGSQRD